MRPTAGARIAVSEKIPGKPNRTITRAESAQLVAYRSGILVVGKVEACPKNGAQARKGRGFGALGPGQSAIGRDLVGDPVRLGPWLHCKPASICRPRTQQTASARCRRRSPRTCQVRCRREPGARHCSVVEILGWINPPGSLPQAGRNREEDRHEWRKGRARRPRPGPR